MSKYNPAVHNRHSIRTKGHDYSKPGFYFITICIKNRRFLLGNKYNCKLNPAGEMVSAEWLELTNRFKNIRLHEFVVMPNHFHALLEIIPPTPGATLVVAPKSNTNDVVAPKSNTENMGVKNGGATNNGATNNGATNDVATNNGATNNGATNDVATNNVATNNGATNNGATTRVAPGVTVGLIIDAFKSITTVKYIRGVKTLGWPPFENKFWQRNYHDRIIIQNAGIDRVNTYIKNNVVNWKGK